MTLTSHKEFYLKKQSQKAMETLLKASLVFIDLNLM